MVTKRLLYSFGKPPLKIGIIVAVILLLGRTGGMFEAWELIAYDHFFQWKPIEPVDKRIVQIVIEEKDVQRAGTYPFTDKLWARLLNKVLKQEPRVVGLDIYRDQPVSPGVEELNQIFKTSDKLIGIAKTTPGKIPAPPILKNKDQYGDASGLLDRDGVKRRAFLYSISDLTNPDSNVTNFAFRLAFSFLNSKNITPKNSSINPIWLQLDNVHIPPAKPNDGGYINAITPGYPVLINWRKPIQQFNIINFYDVLDNKFLAEDFKDKIVIIGVGGDSFGDFHESPMTQKNGIVIRGIDIHAQVVSQTISAVIDNRPLIKVWPDFTESLWIILWCLIPVYLLWWCKIYQRFYIYFGIAIAGVLSIFLIIFCWLAFLQSWWIPVIPALIGIWISCTHVIYFLYENQLRIERNHIMIINQKLENNLTQKSHQLDIAHQAILQEEKFLITQKTLEILFQQIREPTNNLEISLSIIERLIQGILRINSEDIHVEDYLKKILQEIINAKNQWLKFTYYIGLYSFTQERQLARLIPNSNWNDILDVVIEFHLNEFNSKHPHNNDKLSINGNYLCNVKTTNNLKLYRLQNHVVALLSHLINNACEAIEEKLSNSKLIINVEIIHNIDMFKIIVEDNGIGMNENDLIKAKNAFFSTKNKLGMGLYLCQKILEKYKGELKLYSHVNFGTKVEAKLYINSLQMLL